METEVVVKRELFGEFISQKSKSEFFSATDLVKAGNKWRVCNGHSFFNLSQFLKTNSTLSFITELENKYNCKAIINGGKRNSHTWVHPLLFIDIALSINPKLKLEVYDWIFDNLIKYRNESGDSYKKMCGALFQRYGNKNKFHDYISKVAEKIKIVCNVNDWNFATEKQLQKRDKIHDNIFLLADVLNDVETAVNVAIAKAFD